MAVARKQVIISCFIQKELGKLMMLDQKRPESVGAIQGTSSVSCLENSTNSCDDSVVADDVSTIKQNQIREFPAAKYFQDCNTGPCRWSG